MASKTQILAVESLVIVDDSKDLHKHSEKLEGAIDEFVNIQLSLINILVWTVQLVWHLLSVCFRRLRSGPVRSSWDWGHELLVELMQFNYRYHVVKSRQYVGDLADIVLQFGYIRMFRYLISWAPKFPYFPFADCRVELIDCRSQVNIKGLPHCELLNADLSIDIVTCRSVKNSQKKPVILWIHGGAFNFRLEATWRAMVMQFSHELNATIVIPHYRLAPENPFPSGLYDILAAYVWTLENICPDAENIAFFGESAGGGAAVSLALLLNEYRLPKPKCLYLVSPWLDLTCDNLHHGQAVDVPTSWKFNYPYDMLHEPIFPFDLSYNYANGASERGLDLKRTKRYSYHLPESNSRHADLSHPLVSPIFASTSLLRSSLPPMLLQFGNSEYLSDECKSFFSRVTNGTISIKHVDSKSIKCDDIKTGVYQCEAYHEMTHIFPFMHLMGNRMASVALDRAIAYLRHQLD